MSTTVTEQSEWLTLDDLVREFPTIFTKKRVYYLTSSKQIPHYKRGQQLLFKRSEIESWLQSGKVDIQ